MTVASLLKLWTDATGPVQSQSGSCVRLPRLTIPDLGRTPVSPNGFLHPGRMWQMS
jgi:hypothetical protein